MIHAAKATMGTIKLIRSIVITPQRRKSRVSCPRARAPSNRPNRGSDFDRARKGTCLSSSYAPVEVESSPFVSISKLLTSLRLIVQFRRQKETVDWRYDCIAYIS